ncbi:hypothetical protein [Limosilactobacillus antri]|nr:hypothetical protein [Limosilactobacillus antri]
MDTKQVEPGQGWLKTLNNDLTNLDNRTLSWTEWQAANAVLLNGFGRAGNGISVRFLRDKVGNIYLTHVVGEVTKTQYDGRWTDFCRLSDVPQSACAIQAVARIANNDMASGYVSVTLAYSDNSTQTTTLKVGGKYDGGPYLNGWIGFSLMY